MDRINHVKIVTPEPEAVDRFLREVLEIPEGWAIPGAQAGAARIRRSKASPVTWESVIARRGDDGSGGFITGSPESRQFQILRGAQAADLEHRGRHAPHRARAPALRRARHSLLRLQLVDWNERDGVRAFFAEVGGILFEVMRVEPKG